MILINSNLDMKKIQKTSPVITIVNKINELVDLSNEDKVILNSFRNIPEEGNLLYEGLEIDKTLITITSGGLYDISLSASSGSLEIYINESKGMTEYKRILTPDDPSINDLLLLTGDQILLIDKKLPIESKVDIKLNKKLIKAFYDNHFILEKFVDEIIDRTERIEGINSSSLEILQDLKFLRESYSESLELLNDMIFSDMKDNIFIVTFENVDGIIIEDGFIDEERKEVSC